ncbi:MAG: hypothetical protein OK457_05470 [Thaumarchaeota archaeon]|nr:hypothetical protein [Nitrososphaerota archaeon]
MLGKLQIVRMGAVSPVQVNLQSDLKDTWMRIFLILGFSLGSILILSLLGMLLVQSIILVGSFAMIPAILIWEKYSARKRISSKSAEISADERWALIKMDLEKIQREIDKCKDHVTKKNLNSSKYSLENKLRKLEWSIRESDLTQMYNAPKGKINRVPDKIDSSRPKDAKEPGDLEDPAHEKDRPDKEKIVFPDSESRDYLVKTLLDARVVLRNEPALSLRYVLKPTANNLRAHYYILRRRAIEKSHTPLSPAALSDYWVCWALLHSVANNLPLEPNLPKYCSKPLRPKVVSFIKLVNSLGLDPPSANAEISKTK